MLAGASAQKRSTFASAVLGLLVCLLGALAQPVWGANAGGTAPGATRGGSPGAGNAVGTGTSGPHVRSVRITSVKCIPVARCSGNPRQVSVHGTLLIGGIGLKAGMIVAFPAAPGARISRLSPGARLRQGSPGLLVTVPSSAHSGRIMVLLGGGRYTSVYGPIAIFRHALHPPAPKGIPRCCRGRRGPWPRARAPSKARACGSGT